MNDLIIQTLAYSLVIIFAVQLVTIWFRTTPCSAAIEWLSFQAIKVPLVLCTVGFFVHGLGYHGLLYALVLGEIFLSWIILLFIDVCQFKIVSRLRRVRAAEQMQKNHSL